MKRIINVILLVCFAFLALSIPSHASSVPEGCELIRCTCYLPTGNKTASGVYPYEGICASNREHLGDVAVLYTQNMEFIGYFEVKDTGGHPGLKNGSRVDIYRDTKEGVNDWVNQYGDYVIIQWVKGEG